MKKGRFALCAAVCLCALCLAYAARGGRPVWQVFGAQDTPVTLVLDAGHGGFDGGAVGANGTTEQHINLCIARRVRDLAGLFGVPAVLTREDEEALDYVPGRSVRENKRADIQAREAACRAVRNPVFLSIHLNKFEQARYYGAQVFYSGNNAQSRPLAEAIQAALIAGIPNGNDRKAKQAADTIYLMKRLDCPALVVECGFLSNPAEEARLKQSDYQTQLSVCIVSGYLRARGGLTG
ncbi:MAG: N-acetylmuramoyl-L-alanine amidase [Butyricicoccus sp.]|nr:N-acetylmuramoyl-L-alanine amidase [Butyricicoccus sp.]